MSDSGVLIDDLADLAIGFDLTDAAAVDAFCKKLIELASQLKETHQQVSVLASDVAVYLKSDLANSDEAQKILNDTLLVFQQSLVDGRMSSDISFPLIPTAGGHVAGENDLPFKLPAGVDSGIFEEFLRNQPDVLEEMQSIILSIETNPDAKEESQAALKRLIHTLKGESGVLGLDDVQKVCHVVETGIETQDITTLIDKLLLMKDWLADFYKYCTGEGPKGLSGDEFLAQNFSDAPPAPVAEEPAATEEVHAQEKDDHLEIPTQPYAIEDPDICVDFVAEACEHLDSAEKMIMVLEKNPTDVEALGSVFRSFHTIKGTASFIGLKDVQGLAHQAENLLDLARSGKFELRGPALDVTLQASDKMKDLIEKIKVAMGRDLMLTPDAATWEIARKTQQVIKFMLGEIKSLPGAGKEVAVAPKPSPAPKGEVMSEKIETKHVQDVQPAEAVKAEAAKPVHAEVAPAHHEENKVAAKKSAGVVVKETLKVDMDRLDKLIDTIGELVIAESMVARHSTEFMGETASRDVHQLSKITRELQEMGMSLRMVPVRSTFEKMARAVRDLSKKIDKKIVFIMQGEDTELDKGVVEKLGDPLIHMIRNACDHGIETPEARLAAGKPEEGHVHLRAFYRGGNVIIEIEDDGKGLGKDAIVKKAIEKGIITPDQQLSDKAIFDLIFQPGFSTAAKVTEVSGRGVGMDVVKRNIEEINGSVEISSVVGKGSLFTIVLPLTLAIIDGMVVKVGNEKYIIPTLSVVETLSPDPKCVTNLMDKGEIFKWRSQFLPILRLSTLFGIENSKSAIETSLISVVEHERKRIALVVDDLVGQQQTVIKPLGAIFEGSLGFAGGAIMSDGSVGLILDIGGLVKLRHAGEHAPKFVEVAPVEDPKDQEAAEFVM